MYAHVLMEDPRDGAKYHRGDEVPADLPGLDELLEAGSVSDSEYGDAERAAERVQPDEIEIDGVVYRRSSDGAEAGEARN